MVHAAVEAGDQVQTVFVLSVPLLLMCYFFHKRREGFVGYISVRSISWNTTQGRDIPYIYSQPGGAEKLTVFFKPRLLFNVQLCPLSGVHSCVCLPRNAGTMRPAVLNRVSSVARNPRLQPRK